VKFAWRLVEVRLRFIGILVVIGLLFAYWDTLLNHWDKWTRPSTASVALDDDTEFFCPMDPQVVRDSLEPNGEIPKCPICGMPLSKRKKGEAPELPPGVVGRVQLSPERVQMAGIATVPVSYRPLQRELRTVGYVTYDESRLSQIVTRVSGYIEKLHVDRTFATVSAGEPLAEIYSPDLYKAAQELVLLSSNRVGNLLSDGREKLRLLGISDAEIDAILKSGRATPRLTIRSPQRGHVIRKSVVEGSSVQEGEVLFEVADLTSVWIEAEVYEKDISLLREGQLVETTVEAYPGRVFKGKVSLIHPHLERATRTNRVRFELENPNHELRPGMYATVRMTTPIAHLEPFASEIARRRQRPMTDDPESWIAWQQKCPVTNLKLGSMGPPQPIKLGSETVYLCCKACEGKIKTHAAQYLQELAPPPLDAVVAVPQESVIDTGSHKVVYVERESGLYEGVEVVLGPRSGEYYSVLSGLAPGERVAAAGAFLIDAETRLNPAAASTYFGASGQPHGGGTNYGVQRADDRPAAPKSKSKELSPEELDEISRLPLSDQALARKQRLCPISGEPLGSMGVPHKMMIDGQPLFLCCEGCESTVKDDPPAALGKLKL
jgi:Cu(I)/Ag(I) efflux system membrane fusion protein